MFDVFGALKKAKDLIEKAKRISAGAEVLMEDEDHNGKADVQDEIEKAVEELKAGLKIHKAQAKADLANLKLRAKAIKAKLEKAAEEVRK